MEKNLKVPSRAGLGVWVVILALGIAGGIYALVELLTKGQGETFGTSDLVPWGIVVVGYAFFVGITAGATVIGLMIHVFGREDYRPLAIPAILVSLLALVAAVFLIASDIGNLPRMILVPWVLGNPTSVFFYTSLTYYILGIVLLAQLYFTVKLARGSGSEGHRRMAKWLAIAVVPCTFWLQGLLFGVVKAREYWNSPLSPPHSMVGALVSGTAAVVVFALISSLAGRKPLLSSETLNHLGKLMIGFVGVALLFDVVDVAVIRYAETVEDAEIWSLLTGRFIGLYALNIVGLAVALGLLCSRRIRTGNGLIVPALISLLAIAAYRYDLVVIGQSVPLWHGQVGQVAEYSPSGVELLLTVGVVSLILAAYTFLVRRLPLEMAGPVPTPGVSAPKSGAGQAQPYPL